MTHSQGVTQSMSHISLKASLSRQENEMFKKTEKKIKKSKKTSEDIEGMKMISDIKNFEEKLKMNSGNEKVKLSGDEYMKKIKSESVQNRQKTIERNQRRRKVLVETVQGIFTQQQDERDRNLMARVTRESGLERRFATQLLGIREEKDILIENRIRLNQEFEEKRLEKYSQYLDREAEVLRIQKIAENNTRKIKLQEHNQLMETIRKEKLEKHRLFCREGKGIL